MRQSVTCAHKSTNSMCECSERESFSPCLVDRHDISPCATPHRQCGTAGSSTRSMSGINCLRLWTIIVSSHTHFPIKTLLSCRQMLWKIICLGLYSGHLITSQHYLHFHFRASYPSMTSSRSKYKRLKGFLQHLPTVLCCKASHSLSPSP